jgi:hypothetical protein
LGSDGICVTCVNLIHVPRCDDNLVPHQS